jgi:hypothetical protein
MLASIDGQTTNKIAAHWARKLANRKSRRCAFLDLGATSGAGLEEDEQNLDNTGKMSRKNIHVPQWMNWKGNQENAPQA